MLAGLTRFATGQTNYAGASSALGRRLRHISAMERREEARAFLAAFHTATNATDQQRQRR